MTTQVSSQQHVNVKSVSTPLVQNIAALVFGALVVFAVGFVPMESAHNAAHDTRHALAFPCH